MRRESPNAATKSSATTSASSSRSSRSSAIGRDELVERVRKQRQIAELARRRDAHRPLAEAIDPDAPELELVARRDVVEERGGDMHVPRTRRVRAREELVPVTVGGLVR